MTKYILMGVAAFATVVVLFNSLYTVPETAQAMVLRFGKVERVVTDPGLHLKMPFVQQVLLFDKRLLETDSDPEELQTLDKKRVVVDSFTRWRITDAEQFFKSVRTESTAVQRINTIVNSNIRRVVARETLSSLVTEKRNKIMEEIQDASSRQVAELGIAIVDVRIKRSDLPEANASAVFQRMRSERQKEATEIRATGEEEAQKIRAEVDRKRTVILAEADRDAAILRGEGDAVAIKTTAEAFSDDQSFYSFVRSLETYETGLVSDTTLILQPDHYLLKTFSRK